MKKPFDPKKYLGKKRVERKVPGAPNITRLWTWDAKLLRHLPGSFIAHRWEGNALGGKSRKREAFETLEEARAWQSFLAGPKESGPLRSESLSPAGSPATADLGPLFRDVYADFHRRKISKMSSGTRANYDRYIRLHFQGVMDVPIRGLTPQFLDHWIDSLQESVGRTQQSRQRVNFRHEMAAMRSILAFYRDYYDDALFAWPFKARHAEQIQVRKAPPRHKDLTPAEFESFAAELLKGMHGPQMACLATLQYAQALRISEAAGVFHEDVVLEVAEPSGSTLRLCRHVVYPRCGKQAPSIEAGFKNARGGSGSVRIVHLYPEAYRALLAMGAGSKRGLVFGTSALAPFTYRQIQDAYDQAFRKAGLPYRGTHVLRHGGVRRVLNQTGDLTLAQQVLGNADIGTTMIYAKREKGAFRKHVEGEWEKEKWPEGTDLAGSLSTTGHTRY